VSDATVDVATGAPRVSCAGLSGGYGTTTAFRNLDLEVQAGRSVVRTRGRVRSVLPAIGDPNGPPVFAVGLAFLGLAPEDQRSLTALVETLLE